jgi:hypothetical protein
LYNITNFDRRKSLVASAIGSAFIGLDQKAQAASIS